MGNQCEVCGKPAIWMIADTREVEPVADDRGQLWEQRVLKSRHYFCDAHRRHPQVTRKDGRVEDSVPPPTAVAMAEGYEKIGLKGGPF